MPPKRKRGQKVDSLLIKETVLVDSFTEDERNGSKTEEYPEIIEAYDPGPDMDNTEDSNANINCRRSSRKKVIKFDVRDLLNKNRKPHKIQIEARIDSNAPISQTIINKPSTSINVLDNDILYRKCDLSNKQKTYNENETLFHNISLSEQNKPIISIASSRLMPIDKRGSCFAPIVEASKTIHARRLSRTQEIFNASMLKSKQNSSLIIAQMESKKCVSTPNASIKILTTPKNNLNRGRKSLNLPSKTHTNTKEDSLTSPSEVVSVRKRGRPPKNKSLGSTPTIKIQKPTENIPSDNFFEQVEVQFCEANSEHISNTSTTLKSETVDLQSENISKDQNSFDDIILEISSSSSSCSKEYPAPSFKPESVKNMLEVSESKQRNFAAVSFIKETHDSIASNVNAPEFIVAAVEEIVYEISDEEMQNSNAMLNNCEDNKAYIKSESDIKISFSNNQSNSGIKRQQSSSNSETECVSDRHRKKYKEGDKLRVSLKRINFPHDDNVNESVHLTSVTLNDSPQQKERIIGDPSEKRKINSDCMSNINKINININIDNQLIKHKMLDKTQKVENENYESIISEYSAEDHINETTLGESNNDIKSKILKRNTVERKFYTSEQQDNILSSELSDQQNISRYSEFNVVETEDSIIKYENFGDYKSENILEKTKKVSKDIIFPKKRYDANDCENIAVPIKARRGRKPTKGIKNNEFLKSDDSPFIKKGENRKLEREVHSSIFLNDNLSQNLHNSTAYDELIAVDKSIDTTPSIVGQNESVDEDHTELIFSDNATYSKADSIQGVIVHQVDEDTSICTTSAEFSDLNDIIYESLESDAENDPKSNQGSTKTNVVLSVSNNENQMLDAAICKSSSTTESTELKSVNVEKHSNQFSKTDPPRSFIESKILPPKKLSKFKNYDITSHPEYVKPLYKPKQFNRPSISFVNVGLEKSIVVNAEQISSKPIRHTDECNLGENETLDSPVASEKIYFEDPLTNNIADTDNNTSIECKRRDDQHNENISRLKVNLNVDKDNLTKVLETQEIDANNSDDIGLENIDYVSEDLDKSPIIYDTNDIIEEIIEDKDEDGEDDGLIEEDPKESFTNEIIYKREESFKLTSLEDSNCSVDSLTEFNSQNEDDMQIVHCEVATAVKAGHCESESNKFEADPEVLIDECYIYSTETVVDNNNSPSPERAVDDVEHSSPLPESRMQNASNDATSQNISEKLTFLPSAITEEIVEDEDTTPVKNSSHEERNIDNPLRSDNQTSSISNSIVLDNDEPASFQQMVDKLQSSPTMSPIKKMQRTMECFSPLLNESNIKNIERSENSLVALSPNSENSTFLQCPLASQDDTKPDCSTPLSTSRVDRDSVEKRVFCSKKSTDFPTKINETKENATLEQDDGFNAKLVKIEDPNLKEIPPTSSTAIEKTETKPTKVKLENIFNKANAHCVFNAKPKIEINLKSFKFPKTDEETTSKSSFGTKTINRIDTEDDEDNIEQELSNSEHLKRRNTEISEDSQMDLIEYNPNDRSQLSPAGDGLKTYFDADAAFKKQKLEEELSNAPTEESLNQRNEKYIANDIESEVKLKETWRLNRNPSPPKNISELGQAQEMEIENQLEKNVNFHRSLREAFQSVLHEKTSTDTKSSLRKSSESPFPLQEEPFSQTNATDSKMERDISNSAIRDRMMALGKTKFNFQSPDPFDNIEQFIADGEVLLHRNAKINDENVIEVSPNRDDKVMRNIEGNKDNLEINNEKGQGNNDDISSIECIPMNEEDESHEGSYRREVTEEYTSHELQDSPTVPESFMTPADTPVVTPISSPLSKSLLLCDDFSEEWVGVRRSHRIKQITKAPKATVGRGLVRDKDRFAFKDDGEFKLHYSMDEHLSELADVEKANNKFLKDMEGRFSTFQVIKENEYKCDKAISKEARTMFCDCFLTAEEEVRGEYGCGEDCLNRLLMIECGPACNVKDRCTNKRFQKHLYSKCHVFRTEKKGFGILAVDAIKPGEFIMEYVGEVINNKNFQHRRQVYSSDKNRHYYFMALRSDGIIDATSKGNISRFINHSCDPNAETQKWTVNGELRIGFFCVKTIMPGEEITFDYQYQRYGREAQRCFCESENCRGWIGEEPNSDEGEQKDDFSDVEYNLSMNLLPVDDEESDDSVLDPEEVKKRLEKAAADARIAPLSDDVRAKDRRRKINDVLVDEDTNTKFKKLMTKAAERVAMRRKAERKERRHLQRKRREALETGRAYLEDPDIEAEVNSLSISGVQNRKDTLRLSRLIVRGRIVETKLKLLEILRNADLACRRLFLDYQGLHMLHGWLREDNGNMKLRLSLLQTLMNLPIGNKMNVTDTNVYQTVRSWCNPNASEASAVPAPSAIAPSTGTTAAMAAAPAIETSASDNSTSSCTTAVPDTQETPKTEVSNLDTVSSDSQPKSDHFTKDDSNSQTSVTSKKETETSSESISAELQKITTQLIAMWDSLPEIYRIPKRERIEQMKVHEREADNHANRSTSTSDNVDESKTASELTDPNNRARYGDGNSSRFIKPTLLKDTGRYSDSRKRFNVTDNYAGYYSGNSSSLDAAYKHLSKEQRREMFAAQVARDEAEKRWMAERKEFETKCRFFGLDPRQTRICDMPYFFNPNSGQWYSAECRPIPTPPSYLHVPLPFKEKSTDPNDYVLPAIVETLPPHWKYAISTQGFIYYYHVKDRQPQWEPPTEAQIYATDSDEEDSDPESIDSDKEGEKFLGMSEEKLEEYIERKKKELREKRYKSLVESRPISPRRDEDRLYNQIEMRKYKENKEKIRKRKEELRRRRSFKTTEISETKLDEPNVETDNESSNPDKEETVIPSNENVDAVEQPTIAALPIQDYLLSSDEEEFDNSSDCTTTNTLLVDKIVDELDALNTKRSLKRTLHQPSEPFDIVPVASSVSSTTAEEINVINNKAINASPKISTPAIAPSVISSLEKHKKRKHEKKERSKRMAKEIDPSKSRRLKEKFRCEIAGVINRHLKSFCNASVSQGRIESNSDLNHLTRKLAHFVTVKELKYCESVGQIIVVTDSVKNKTRDFITKYMSKYGAVYKRPESDPDFKEVPV